MPDLTGRRAVEREREREGERVALNQASENCCMISSKWISVRVHFVMV